MFLGVACLYRSWRGGTMRSRLHLWRKAAMAPAQAARISTTIVNSAGCIRKLTNCTAATPGERRQQHRTFKPAAVYETPRPEMLLPLLLIMIGMLLIGQVCTITWAYVLSLASADGVTLLPCFCSTFAKCSAARRKQAAVYCHHLT